MGYFRDPNPDKSDLVVLLSLPFGALSLLVPWGTAFGGLQTYQMSAYPMDFLTIVIVHAIPVLSIPWILYVPEWLKMVSRLLSAGMLSILTGFTAIWILDSPFVPSIGILAGLCSCLILFSSVATTLLDQDVTSSTETAVQAD